MEKLGIIEARVVAAKESKGKAKDYFIVVDADGDCTVEVKRPSDPSTIASIYRNGSEVKEALDVKEISEPVKPKTSKKVETTKTGAKAKLPKAKKVAAKKVAKKSNDRKAISGEARVKALIANGAKKVTLSIADALKRSAKDSLYRASNGSPLGKYYLADYKDKTKKVEFLVKAG